MKLKTKMLVLFFTIVLVPLVFGTFAFLGISYYENINVIQELSKEDIMLGALINKRFMSYIVLSMIIILIITSSIITAWVTKLLRKI